MMNKVVTLSDYTEAPSLLVVEEITDPEGIMPEGYRVYHIATENLPGTFEVPGHGYAQPWNAYTVLREDCEVLGKYKGPIPEETEYPEWTSYHHEGMVVALLSMGKCLDL